jgi:RNA polymerase sigma-70 factor (sigma-E family)
VSPSWEQDFVEYVRARIPRLHRVAFQLLGDGDRADDVVQNVLATLYRRWSGMQGVDNLDAYVHTMVVHACLADRRAPWARVLLRDTAPDSEARHVDGEIEQRLQVRAALRSLPERQRIVLVLRFLCDLPVSEVARLLNRSEGTVKSRTAYGLEALRKALGAPGPAPSSTGGTR